MRHGHFIKILRTNQGAVTPNNINKTTVFGNDKPKTNILVPYARDLWT